MKQDEKDVFIRQYGARAIEIRGSIPWEEVPKLEDVVNLMEGDEVYVNSHSVYRAGIVVHVARTRATVMLTTEGAVQTSLRSTRGTGPHFTFATQPIKDLGTK